MGCPIGAQTGRITRVTPEQTAGAARAPVARLGGAFAEDPKTLRRARQLGLTGWAFYVTGRAGALGDVRSDTAAAALGFISAEAVHDGWEAARKVTSPAKVAEYHREECCRWGTERMGGVPGLTRMVELAERVVLAADAAGLPLFAAWRAMPVPADGPGARAAVLMHLLREHRAGAHLLAIRAGGLTPLEALITGPDGEAGAVAYGWQPPYPRFEPLVRRRMWAEALTHRIAGEAYRVLSTAERTALVGLLEGAVVAVGEPAGEYPTVG
jgi:hypothetical protein